MNREKWDFYINSLQSHPSLALTNKSAEGLSWLKEKLPLGKCLCVGAADGAEVKALNDLGYDAMGITLGQNNVDYGKKKYEVDLQVMDMHNLSFGTDTFGCAYSCHSFEHVFAPWIHVMEVWSVLKSHGKWFLQHPNYNPDAGLGQQPNYHHPNVAPSDYHRYIFECCGFIVDEYEQIGAEDRWLLKKDQTLSGVHGSIKNCLANRKNL